MYIRHAGGFGPIHVLFFVFLLLVVIGLAWLLVQLALGRFTHPHSGGSLPLRASPTAIETLDMRYARGEISRDEYLQARADLGPPTRSG